VLASPHSPLRHLERRTLTRSYLLALPHPPLRHLKKNTLARSYLLILETDRLTWSAAFSTAWRHRPGP
jgi:hypothetical protein